MKIILIRHGKPVIPPLNKLSPSMFSEWVNSYNRSGLCATSKPTDEAINIAQQCRAVVCSELPRSIESAKALGVESVALISAKFNEAELPIANWHFPRFSPKAWAVIFRILWFLGYSRNAESFKQAKARASEAANILKQLAEQNTTVLFVGHGVYNRLVANELNASGWYGPRNPGSKHWGFGIYQYKPA